MARQLVKTVTTRCAATEIFHGAGLDVDLLLDELLDLAHQARIVVGHQGHGNAGGACAARAADAVHIVFGVEGHVVVEDGRHVLDVQATGRDVGTHQQIHLAALEGFKRLQALVLALVAVQRRCAQAITLQSARQARTAQLAVGEDEGLADVALLEQGAQRCLLYTSDAADE